MTKSEQSTGLGVVGVAGVSREDAITFLESACRNWSKVPRLSNDDIDDVATELSHFVAKRAPSMTPTTHPATGDVGALKFPLPSWKEQAAFEDWATDSLYEMEQHPLHYLFMDRKTNAARQGWKAALAFVRKLIEEPRALTTPEDQQ